MSNGTVFTPEEITRVLELRGDGLTWEEIGRRLGRSRTACQRRAQVFKVYQIELNENRVRSATNMIAEKAKITEEEIMNPPHLNSSTIYTGVDRRTSFIEGLAAGAWMPSEHEPYFTGVINPCT